MSIFNKIIKAKEKGAQEAKPAKQADVIAKPKPLASKKEIGQGEKKALKRAKLSKDKASQVVKKPLITEKSSFLAAENKYVFAVAKNATKNEIKKAVEGIYNVNALSVNIIKVPAKSRQRGLVKGAKSGFKKAIVTIKQGESINEVKSS